MSCCKVYEFPFANVAFSTINYTDDMLQNLGQVPNIQVLYYDPTTDDFYLVNGISSTEKKFDGSTISIDHGGIATGVVKVS